MQQFHIHYLMRYSEEHSEMDGIFFITNSSSLNTNRWCGLLIQPMNNKPNPIMQVLSPGPTSFPLYYMFSD